MHRLVVATSAVVVLLQALFGLPLVQASSQSSSPSSTPTTAVDNTYTDPEYGWSVTWPEDWRFLEYPNPRPGQIRIVNDRFDIMISRLDSSIDEDLLGVIDLGDTASCLQELESAFVMSQRSDNEGKPQHLETPERSWSLYEMTVTFPSGESRTSVYYVECRVLVPGEALLLILARGPDPETFDAHEDELQAILDSIRLTQESETRESTPASPEADR